MQARAGGVAWVGPSGGPCHTGVVLWSVAFGRIGVVVGDLYFVDPQPSPGQDGAERGVRLELREFDRDELVGSIYSAVPIRVGRPLWRVDLLESVTSAPGSLDRAHHHPGFNGWEPGKRVFVEELSQDPVGWLRGRFTRIEEVLDAAGVPEGLAASDDVAALKAAGPMVVAVVEQLLQDVAAGRAAVAPADAGESVRSSWL
jgi:hypothetical protein